MSRDTLIEIALYAALALAVCLVVGLVIYADWMAFRQKFPEAAWWAFFFYR